MCGEKQVKVVEHCNKRGSPPHVRGKDKSWVHVDTRPRITPACAGKRRQHGLRGGIPRDHPRMCGEKKRQKQHSAQRTGSPPHVRGKAVPSPDIIPANGITPACAGKSLPSLSFAHTYWDHPRMCGEKFLYPSISGASIGSPPHVRGKVNLIAPP